MRAFRALYKKYGYYIEKTESSVFSGYDAQDKMKAVMSSLRSRPAERDRP